SLQPARATASPLGAAASLPTELDWRTGVRLSLLSTNWQALYLVGDQPVLAQRRWGAGELCMTTDAYPFSNEGMVKDRHPGLLAWFLGERRIVAFEETHLGTERSGGVAVLARHYRLHGFLVGALLVLGLAVLRAQWPLVPRTRTGNTEDEVAGLASDAGLASLVQRAIPSEELPRLALEEWTRSVGNHHPGWTPLLGQLAQQVQQDAARGSHHRDAVGTLVAMTELVRSSRATRQATAASPLDLPRP
ncbi:MAG: hypothetical protein IT580_20625, partial [Verrucomicrobiales bacterium]|nr:hypothetical protein [Verrucomicrobiales bacterium]